MRFNTDNIANPVGESEMRKKWDVTIKYMKKGGNNRSLESFKIFPYLAWTLVVGFCFLVYLISTELKTVTEELSLQSEFLEAQVKKNPTEIKNFAPPQNTTQE